MGPLGLEPGTKGLYILYVTVTPEFLTKTVISRMITANE